MTEPRMTYSVKLRPEAASAVEGAMEPGESPAAFAAKALVCLALKRKQGRWPRKIPSELMPRKAGRPWPSADDEV
jgi:hypothetical protein